AAADAGIPTAFLGGGTHSSYGSRVDVGLVVTTSRLNRIVDWQADDLTVRVEPGVRIEALEERLAERNQTAVFPETAPGATVGGVIAAGLSGYRRLRYGPTRDRVLEVQIATGYGKVITGGSPVVKSSTGYGVPRLATGSLGSLGLIGQVMLKLWSRPQTTVTVPVDDAAEVLAGTYRPLAVLETSEGSYLYLGGPPEQVAVQAGLVGGEPTPGLAWPDAIDSAIRLEFRVPARLVRPAIDRARRLGAKQWIAEHGVGRVEAAVDTVDPGAFSDARSWAESAGGALVVAADDDLGIDAWGAPPASIEIQRRIKSSFDPSGICNPGILPGGL
ncbi:MAG: FAD-binding protein, partial [Actinomycetota bacterium]